MKRIAHRTISNNSPKTPVCTTGNTRTRGTGLRTHRDERLRAPGQPWETPGAGTRTPALWHPDGVPEHLHHRAQTRLKHRRRARPEPRATRDGRGQPARPPDTTPATAKTGSGILRMKLSSDHGAGMIMEHRPAASAGSAPGLQTAPDSPAAQARPHSPVTPQPLELVPSPRSNATSSRRCRPDDSR